MFRVEHDLTWFSGAEDQKKARHGCMPGIGIRKPSFSHAFAPTTKTQRPDRQICFFFLLCCAGWLAGGWLAGGHSQICPPTRSHASASSGQNCATCSLEEASRLAGLLARPPACPMVACCVVVAKLGVRTLFPCGGLHCALALPERIREEGLHMTDCHMPPGGCFVLRAPCSGAAKHVPPLSALPQQ